MKSIVIRAQPCRQDTRIQHADSTTQIPAFGCSCGSCTHRDTSRRLPKVFIVFWRVHGVHMPRCRRGICSALASAYLGDDMLAREKLAHFYANSHPLARRRWHFDRQWTPCSEPGGNKLFVMAMCTDVTWTVFFSTM